MAGNSSRKGAVRGGKKPRAVGTGGKGKAKLSGRGPTPKATERPHHPAAKAKARAKKAASAGTGKATPRATQRTTQRTTGSAESPRSTSRTTTPRHSEGVAAPSRAKAGTSTSSRAKAGTSTSSGTRSGTQGRTGGTRTGSRGTRVATHDWISGRNAVLEALQANVPVDVVYVMASIDTDDRVRDIISACRKQRLQLLEVSRTDLDRMTTRMVHQGVAARIPTFRYSEPMDIIGSPAQPALIVAVDGLTDPRNLGAIIRSAAAFGATGVVVPERRAVGVTPATWKTSAGAAARMKVAKATNLVRALKDYQAAGCFVVGLAGDGDDTVAGIAEKFLSGPTVIVVGAEGAGLSRLVRETCDVIAGIEIGAETESLNASVATSIALYEASKSRA